MNSIASADPRWQKDEPVSAASSSGFWNFWNQHLGALVLIGLVLGVAAGLFFGEYCSFLSWFGDAFVGLLRMTVLPYIATSLVVNLGRLPLSKTRHLAVVGSLVQVALWCMLFALIVLLPSALPAAESGSFFSAAMVDPATNVDMLSIFVPSNIFTALANNHVPAIIFFCICMGASLATIPNRAALIDQLQVVSEMMLRVTGFISRLAPIGVFAIAASTAGTMSFSDFGKLQPYLILYGLAALLMGFVLLPLLITSLTPLTYRQVWQITREPMITAFATGKLMIVLPLLIENTERQLSRSQPLASEQRQELELLYTVAYAFPHAGKMLSMLFVPFVAWFFGDRIAMTEYPHFLSSGLAAYFAGPLVAIPFLLDQMHLPHDMFQLFLLTGIVGERLGDALGVMHLAALALVTLALLQGSRRRIALSSLQFAVTFAITGLLAVVLARVLLNQIPVVAESKAELIAQMQLIERPVQATVVLNGQPNPERLQPGESVIERIRRRGVMRVGFNEDKLPFAFFNARRELVGLDIDLAHALARDLGVTLEFVRFDRSTLVQQLQADHFDFVMSGLVGTLERSEAMQHTHSYMDATLGLVVPDFRVRDFKSLNSIRQIDGLRIGFVDLSRGFISRLDEVLPDAELVELRSNRDYFENSGLSLDALLVSAETGSAFTLLYPAHEIVIPAELDVKMPLFYAITGRDEGETRTFLNHWIELRQKDGTFRDYYEHWILGKSRHPQEARWSVLQNVLGWGR